MSQFLKKIKNNRGDAEGAMFVMGIAIFATIVVFSLNIFNLTWQRYLSTREISNMSRLYAVRAMDLYIKDGPGRVSERMQEPVNSELGKEMQDSMKKLVDHTIISEAILTITTEGGVELLRITASGTNTQLTAAGYDIMKTTDYGDTLIAKLKVSYENAQITNIAGVTSAESSYTISNKFAYEDYAKDTVEIS